MAAAAVVVAAAAGVGARSTTILASSYINVFLQILCLLIIGKVKFNYKESIYVEAGI